VGQPHKVGTEAVVAVFGAGTVPSRVGGALSRVKLTKRICSNTKREETCKHSFQERGETPILLQEGISMKRLKLISAVAVVLAAASMLYLVRTLDAQGAEATTVVVTITPSETAGEAPSVDKPEVTISKKDNQQVEWTCKGGCDFSVEFSSPSGSPFSHNSFAATKANPHALSGPPNKVGTFKYSVTANGGTLDPMIIVK
jgi:hypothetical protein